MATTRARTQVRNPEVERQRNDATAHREIFSLAFRGEPLGTGLAAGLAVTTSFGKPHPQNAVGVGLSPVASANALLLFMLVPPWYMWTQGVDGETVCALFPA